jgi:hypothetical protein
MLLAGLMLLGLCMPVPLGTGADPVGMVLAGTCAVAGVALAVVAVFRRQPGGWDGVGGRMAGVLSGGDGRPCPRDAP